MNVKLIIAIAIIVVAIVLIGFWYWYVGMKPSIINPSGYDYQSGQSANQSNGSGAAKTSFDSTSDISGDLNAIPNDSDVDSSVKLVDGSIGKF